MKKPKLNKVDPSTMYQSCKKLQELWSAGAMQDYHSEAQRLIDLFIPEGWRLGFEDTDADVFDGRIDHIHRTFDAVDELNCCYMSCSTLRVTEKIKRIVVRKFTTWLSKQFKQFGKEVK